jgi:hypothetical protein
MGLTMANSAWTGTSDPLDQLTRGQQAEARRLTGLSVIASQPGWAEAQDALIEKAMERQRLELEAALRRQALARVSVTRPQPPSIFGAPVTGPLAPQNVGGTLSAAGEAIGGVLTSEAPMLGNPTTDPLGNPLPGAAQELPPGATKQRGPMRAGYIQQPIADAQGATIGYKYVALPSAEAPEVGPLGTTAAEDQASREEGQRRNYPLPTPGDVTEDIRQGYFGNDSQYGFGTMYVEAQKGAYGEPIGYEEAPDGTRVPVYDTEKQKFIGIDEQDQRYGYVAGRPVAAPGPDATDEERAKYRDYMQRRAIVAPKYRINDDLYVTQNMTTDQQKSMQKAFKAAGLYEADDLIEFGKMGEKDKEILRNVMGFANQQGLTVPEALQVIRKHKERLEAQKNAAGGGGGGSGPITRQVQITYNQTSLAQGRGTLASVLSTALGRPPTDQELAQYMQMLNRAENKSPTRTVTNYVRSGSSQTSTSRTNPSDVDPEAMAREFATQINGGEEFFDMQANSYLDSLMASLIGAQNV